jgi:2-keto-3-deoxy-L-rhamnonate aldolase RhmA
MEDYCAASLFQPSNLAKALEDTMDPSSGRPTHLMGTIVSIPHTISARTLAVLGYDFVMIDAQHTLVPSRTQQTAFSSRLTQWTVSAVQTD